MSTSFFRCSGNWWQRRKRPARDFLRPGGKTCSAAGLPTGAYLQANASIAPAAVEIFRRGAKSLGELPGVKTYWPSTHDGSPAEQLLVTPPEPRKHRPTPGLALTRGLPAATRERFGTRRWESRHREPNLGRIVRRKCAAGNISGSSLYPPWKRLDAYRVKVGMPFSPHAARARAYRLEGQGAVFLSGNHTRPQRLGTQTHAPANFCMRNYLAGPKHRSARAVGSRNLEIPRKPTALPPQLLCPPLGAWLTFLRQRLDALVPAGGRAWDGCGNAVAPEARELRVTAHTWGIHACWEELRFVLPGKLTGWARRGASVVAIRLVARRWPARKAEVIFMRVPSLRGSTSWRTRVTQASVAHGSVAWRCRVTGAAQLAAQALAWVGFVKLCCSSRVYDSGLANSSAASRGWVRLQVQAEGLLQFGGKREKKVAQ